LREGEVKVLAAAMIERSGEADKGADSGPGRRYRHRRRGFLASGTRQRNADEQDPRSPAA
jgi:hypothetical protein